MGGGKREYERPGILRAMLIERLSETVNSGETDVTGTEGTEDREDTDRKSDTVNRNDNGVKMGKKGKTGMSFINWRQILMTVRGRSWGM
jgi:hypothetical protein